MTNTEQRSPFSRPGFIAAAIVVGVIVLAAIIVLVTSLTRDSDANTAQPTSNPTSTSPSGDAADKSVCGLPGFDTENTLTNAPDTKWELVGTVAAPTDPKGAGPGTIDGGFRSCYAHTAEGALFASINLMAMGTDNRLAPELSKRFLVPGPGQDAALEREKSGENASDDQNFRAQLAGFKINSYSVDETTVDLVFQVSSSGALVSIPNVLQWSGGDWKGVTDAEGNNPLQPAQVENLGSYIPWSGA
ncbi:hypothetical protein [Cryobacterium sp. CG_9.6]|uniref:hypothetical protein n=1 Tax=Cryobacterium sp. CG_9.6 TaxID=2760710 RepID=UPI002472FC8D|nr:hypothetical protein [Cryobacterium sp. CG_9.6]MDH6238559.1 hypothetical protein [Cryobacterium sp. CG_9.6]